MFFPVLLLAAGPRLRSCGIFFATALLAACPSLRADGPEAGRVAEPSRPTLTWPGHLWSVAEAQRGLEFPVDLDVSIRYYDPFWRLLWVEKESVGGFVRFKDKPLPFRAGQRVRLTGTVIPADGLDADRLTVTVISDRDDTPPAGIQGRLHDHNPLQGRLTRFQGYVQRQNEVDARHLSLEVVVDGRVVGATLLLSDAEPLPQLEDAHVEITAVYVAKIDNAGNAAVVDFWIPSSRNIQILGWLQSDARFNQPPLPIDQLTERQAGEAVMVTGTAHAYTAGKSLTVRDGTGQVDVEIAQTRPIRLGEQVEVIGKTTGGSAPSLRDGVFRLRTTTLPSTTRGLARLRLASQILDLRHEDAMRGHPAKISGVVTWAHPSADYIFLQDTSGGIRVTRAPGAPPLPGLHKFIQIVGHTDNTGFAPSLVATSLEPDQARDASPPAARLVTLDQALTGIEEGQWIELRGFLREVSQEDAWSHLALTTSSGEFTATLPYSAELEKLVGATVRVRGVCVAVANARRQLTSIKLLVPNAASVQVEDSAPADPFDVPTRSITNLRQFSTFDTLNRRVRVMGQVVHHVPGHHVRIQDSDTGILALSRNTAPLKPGDHVEVVGFPGREGSRVVLREAIYRRVSDGNQPVPTPLKRVREPMEDLDSRLVTAEGLVLEVSRRGQEQVFIVQGDDGPFEGLLQIEDASASPAPPVASRVRLTGVYQVQFDEYRKPHSFHLRLRSPDDVAILVQPSWWTTRRALSAAGLLGACVLLGAAWLFGLRRRVQEQTTQIRDQVEKEASLQARHREIVENASDFIFTTDRTGRFTSFNPAGERITGYTREEALGMNLRDLIAPDETSRTLPLFDLRPDHEGAVMFQLRFKTRAGRVLWVETSARLLRHTGHPDSILGVARDISDRKQIEEELRRARDAAQANTEAKSAFLANMSHEIRTPMNGVIGMSNLLLDTPLSDEQRDFAETIRNSAEALLTVLNDILDFSKIEAGKLSFETIDFDLAETVESTLELMAARASAKGLELASFLPHELPRQVRGDPGRLRQVLLNLIGNAIKFTEQGEVIVALAVEQDNARDVRIHIEVTDTGMGIPAEVQTQLFQPFSQADSSTTRRFGGTGLGLAISKQIVQLMDGEIGVRSTPHQGSTFWFTVRLEKQPFDLPQEEPLQITALNGLRALVVDDNATNRKILQHYAVGWGLRSETAPSGAAALKMLREAAKNNDPFHLIMLDYQMPEMDGLMFASEVFKDAAIVGARMVLLTSWDRRFSREELLEAGIVRMLVKPVRQQDLLAALLRCVRVGAGSNPSIPPPPMRELPAGSQPRRTALAGGRPLRVLIAEDNMVNQRVAVLQMQNLGHTVDLATNGLEVLEALERASYDVILMDGQMPEMDGYEATRRIRQNPRHAALWIIAMTANAMQGDRERCIEAGMDDYVSKPTRVDDLRAALARCQSAIEATS